MKIAVIGSKDWEDYNTLMRKLTVELEDWSFKYGKEDKLSFVHTGSRGAENMVTEWVGKVERLLKQNGVSITEYIFRAKPDQNRDYELLNSGVDKVLIFQKEGCKRTQAFAKLAQAHDIPVTIVKG